CIWRRGDRQFLRFAQTAGKAEARWLNIDRESRCNCSASRSPTRGRSEGVAHGARPSAARRALHVANVRKIESFRISASIWIGIEIMLSRLVHHQTGKRGFAQINPTVADVIRVPWSCSIFLGAAI